MMNERNAYFQNIFATVFDETVAKVEQAKKGKRKAQLPQSDAGRNLIINYLPREMDETALKHLFSLVGEVDKVHLMRDMSDKSNGPGESLGYGFVDYKSASDGERAIEILNETKILNKTIKVSYSRPSSDDIKLTNIYVSGLPKSFTENDLNALFSKYGTIISSKLIKNEGSDGRNIAFVRFDKREQANNAIIATNNTKIPGFSNNIQVRFSLTPNNKNMDLMKRRKIGDFSEVSGQEGDYAIYVYNLNPQTDDNTLWKLFGAFGAIKNAKAVIDPETNKCKGFGFITMKNLNEAIQAIQTLNGYTHDNRVLQVSFKNKKDGDLDIKGLNLTELTGTYTLYVFNLNPETDDTTVWKLFGQFGAVKNVKVIRDEENQKGRGFAFITMKNIDEAAKAVKILNGFTLDNRVLQVSFKTQKNSDHGDYPMNETINDNVPAHIARDRAGAIQIFIYNLAPETEEGKLWRLFGQFGAVKNVKVLEDKSPKFEYKGHAFVSMLNFQEATQAIENLNGVFLDGRPLQVSFKLNKNSNN